MSEQPTILLMDEDAQTLEQLQTVLQREGYRVLVAADGHAGLRLARRTTPSLIISDVLLAGLDGYEVWQILQADKEIPKIPVLVVSTLTIPPRNEPWRPHPNAEWQLLSYDAFLPKPLDLRRFIRVVKRLLQPDQVKHVPGGPSVLLAIEDHEFQSSLASMLSQHDFGIEVPPSLVESMKLVSAVPPAVLVLDYRDQNNMVKDMVAQTRKVVPGTVIILIVSPHAAVEAELIKQCDGFLSPDLSPIHAVTIISQILDLYTLRRRTDMLSSHLIKTNRDLQDTQQVLRAQNEELQHINAQLRELDSLKETFTGMLVHDLKTPLSAVVGTLSFLSTDKDLGLDSTYLSLLNGAMAAANQMTRLTETLLEGQRLENGHLEPDLEPVDLPAIVDTSLHQISPLLTLHQVKTKLVLPTNLPLVYADPYITQRVFENLLDNAIKFSPSRSTIIIRATANQEQVTVSIEDQGPGIAKDQQSEIFNQFSQIKNADKPSSRVGFGLGLTFCHLAVQAMNGSIWVESDGESGTDFLFTLPVYSDEE